MKNWAITITHRVTHRATRSAALWIALAAAACQAPGPSGAALQAQTTADDCFGVANFCQATMPAISSWTTGDPFPQSTPTTVVVIMRISSAVWQAFGADPMNGKVLWARSMKPDAVGAFLNLADGGKLKYGGVRGPINPTCPPDCGVPLPGFLLEAAKRFAPVQDQAQAAEDACFLK